MTSVAAVAPATLPSMATATVPTATVPTATVAAATVPAVPPVPAVVPVVVVAGRASAATAADQFGNGRDEILDRLGAVPAYVGVLVVPVVVFGCHHWSPFRVARRAGRALVGGGAGWGSRMPRATPSTAVRAMP